MSESAVPLLLSLADDELVLGYRDSEWTGIAPMLEEDVATSSISQDEIGHAKALYEIVREITGAGVDDLAYGREPREYRCCWLVERPRHDWAFTIARRFLYETADDVRTEALVASSFEPLAGLMRKVRREEKYHLMHVSAWLDRLSESGEARPRLESALALAWPDALTFWEEIEGEDEFLAGGCLPAPSPELRRRWLERVERELAARGLDMPRAAGPEPPTGRGGARTGDFEPFWLEMTETYRLEPGATW